MSQVFLKKELREQRSAKVNGTNLTREELAAVIFSDFWDT